MNNKTGESQMNNIFRFGFAALCLCGAAASQAADTQPYFGVKAGLMMPDANGFDDALNIGGVVGVPVTELRRDSSGIAGTISVEGELTLTLVEGDVNINVPPFGNFSGDWDVWTLGGFGVYRSPASNNLYFKGKLGLVHSDVDVSVAGSSASGSDTELAIGFGLGYKLGGRSNLEFEFTLLDDLDFLSVAYHF
jgi:hypothetical protein